MNSGAVTNQSTSSGTNLYDPVTRDIKSRPSDDTHVNYNTGLTEASPGDEYVYYNNMKQTVALPGGEHMFYNDKSGDDGFCYPPRTNALLWLY